MGSVVVDASAVLAVLRREPGGDEALAHFSDAVISAVNVAEVASVLTDLGMRGEEIRLTVADLGLKVAPFDEEQGLLVGELRALTRGKGLSLGDRACLALAKQRRLPALTADRAWAEVGWTVEVRLIRPV